MEFLKEVIMVLEMIDSKGSTGVNIDVVMA